METLTRLVSESLARHGFDRPIDYRRLQWSRWFRCESHHSLLVVPSKPGVFALAEEVMNLADGTDHVATATSASVGTGPSACVETGVSPVPRPLSEAKETGLFPSAKQQHQDAVEERRFSAAAGTHEKGASAPVVPEAGSREPEAAPRRMLAVTQFFEDDDMAFVLDRMLSRNNPMRARLESGRYFIRFVQIQDQAQRRSICNALNQWIASSSEKATGIGGHFATSLELTPATEPASSSVGRTPTPANAGAINSHAGTPTTAHQAGTAALARLAERSSAAPATTQVYRSPLFPSGF